MLRHPSFLALLLFLSPIAGSAREAPDVASPSFTTVPELSAGFDLLYEQKFAEAREGFANWESHNPEQPFGEVAVAASYLFEELSRQGVLTSDFFLNEKKFLRGIDGSPDPEPVATAGRPSQDDGAGSDGGVSLSSSARRRIGDPGGCRDIAVPAAWVQARRAPTCCSFAVDIRRQGAPTWHALPLKCGAHRPERRRHPRPGSAHVRKPRSRAGRRQGRSRAW